MERNAIALLLRTLTAVTLSQRRAHGWIGAVDKQLLQRGQSLKAVDSRVGRMQNVETKEEYLLRQLWQDERTFETANRVVDAVLLPDAWNSSVPLLKRLCGKEEEENEYESLFSVLFEPQDDASKLECPNDAVLPNTRTKSFRIDLAYRGSDFCGWQRQLDHALPSVQGTVEDWLLPLHSNKRVDVRVSGRTDAGVHALRQTCRFRTWQSLEASEVMKHMQQCLPGSIQCRNVTRVTSAFHPTFGATCRAYAYIVELQNNSTLSERDVVMLNDMLQSLEGLELDYHGMASGKVNSQTSLCTIHYARAFLVTHDDTTPAICIQLVADRFLRRMVRILVATALRETIKHEENASTRLLDIVLARDRQASAKAAPPHGLMFVEASFQENAACNGGKC